MPFLERSDHFMNNIIEHDLTYASQFVTINMLVQKWKNSNNLRYFS